MKTSIRNIVEMVIPGLIKACAFNALALALLSGCTANVSISDILSTVAPPATPPSTSTHFQSLGASNKMVNSSSVGTLAIGAPTYTLPTTTQTFYVDASVGSDSYTGLSEAQAWRTISKAASTLTAGQKVLIKNGVYRESITPLNSGTSTSPIIYENFPGHQPVIKGSIRDLTFEALGARETGGLFIGSAETGDLTEFNSNQADLLIVSTTEKHSGTSSYEFSYGATTTTNRLANELSPAPSGHVYLRFFIKLDENFDLKADNNTQRIALLRDKNPSKDMFNLMLQKQSSKILVGATYRTAISDASNVQVPQVISGSENELIRGQWNSIEMHYQTNVSAGSASLWVNDVLIATVNNIDTTGLNLERFEIGTPSSTGYIKDGSKFWIDDARLASTKNGAIYHGGAPGVYKTDLTATPYQLFVDDEYYPSITYSNPNFTDAYETDPSTALSTLPAKTFYYDSTSKELFLRLAANANPNLHVVEVGKLNELVSISNTHHLVFKGLILQHANKDNGGAFALRSSSNIKIINNTIKDNFGAAVLIRNSSSENLVGKNQLWNNKKEFGSGVRIDMKSHHNTIEYNTVSNTTDFSTISVVTTGLPTTFNYTDHAGGSAFFFRFDGDSSQPENYGPPHHNIIRYNRVDNVVDSGVYLADQAEDNDIYGNIISNVFAARPWGSSGGNGIHIAKSSLRNNVYNNIIYNLDTSAVNLRYGAGENRIYNNTLFNSGLKSAWHSSKSSLIAVVGPTSSSPTAPASFGNKIFNNIFHTAKGYCYDIDTESVQTGTNQFDANLCYNIGGDGLYRYAGIDYQSLTSFQAASNQESAGKNQNPDFSSLIPTNPDFNFSSSSPAYGGGINPSPAPLILEPSGSSTPTVIATPTPPSVPPVSDEVVPPPDTGSGNQGGGSGLTYTLSAVPSNLDLSSQAYFTQDISYGPHSRHKFDVIFPKAAYDNKTPTPLVIFVHSGGFTSGSKEVAYDKRTLIRGLVQQGIAFAAINYPLVSSSSTRGVIESLEGSRRALQFIRHHATDLNIQKTKVIMAGSSAGGATSLWLAFHDEMANPSSTDLVERESTRVLAAIATETQSTLDVVKWENIFSAYNVQISSMGSQVLNFYSIASLNEVYVEPMVSYRANIDMLALMDSNDPEIWVQNSEIDNTAPNSTSKLFHHPLHAKALQEQASAVGLPGVFKIPKMSISTSNETDIEFAIRKFNAAP